MVSFTHSLKRGTVIRSTSPLIPPASDPLSQTDPLFYKFLEIRYRGEIQVLTDRIVNSPIDRINRPTHTRRLLCAGPPVV